MEKSKEFKRTSSEEVRHEVSPLMKAFQSEVGVICFRTEHTLISFPSHTYITIQGIPKTNEYLMMNGEMNHLAVYLQMFHLDHM